MRTLARCFWPTTALVLVLVVASSAITAAAGDGAIVYNRDEAICRFVYDDGSTYTGQATFAITPNGHLTIQCNASLVDGTPVARATRWDRLQRVTMSGDEYWVPCTIQFTPSGNANLRCNAWIDGQ